MIFTVYIGGVISVSNDIDMLNREKVLLCQRFEMTDKGEARHILGMLIKQDRDKNQIFVSQQRYLESVLHHCGMRIFNQFQLPWN